MELNYPRHFALAVLTFSAGTLFQPASAIVTTPAEQDKLHIHTGIPTKKSDALFSYTVEWRIDDGELYRASGLSFLNAAKLDSTISSAVIAKKFVTAMKDGMVQLDPNWRGITINQIPDKPEVALANKTGFSITNVTVRDYTNQTLSYDLAGKSFAEAGVDIAVDLVLAADVEYLDEYAGIKSQTVSAGEIEIDIDQQKPIHVNTDGKTTRELEQEIAQQLSTSHFSDTPLFPSLASKDTRNIKPFDGSEVQFLNIAAKTISIGVKSPELGVIAKFKYKDENRSLHVIEPRFMLAALPVVSLLIVGFIWLKNKKQRV